MQIHADHCFSPTYLQEIKKDSLATACSGKTIWGHTFHDPFMTFCKGPTQITDTTAEGQEIVAKLRQGRVLTSYRGKISPARSRDTAAVLTGFRGLLGQRRAVLSCSEFRADLVHIRRVGCRFLRCFNLHNEF